MRARSACSRALSDFRVLRYARRPPLRRVEIPPFKFKIVMVQTLGVAFPSNNNAVCQGYRYGFSFS